MPQRICIVIPSYNGGDLLRRAVDSVTRANQGNLFECHTIVIDNHPDSLDVGILEAVDVYLQFPENPGFGVACNSGIQLALDKWDCDWILLLNPDAELDTLFFLNLAKAFDRGDLSDERPISPIILFDNEVYAARVGDVLHLRDDQSLTMVLGHEDLVFYDGWGRPYAGDSLNHVRVKGSDWLVRREMVSTFSVHAVKSIYDSTVDIPRYELTAEQFEKRYLINSAGSYVFPPWTAGDLNFGFLYLPELWRTPLERSAWCGAAVLLPRKYLREVGGFDPRFFLYYEDVELSVRGTSAGYGPVFYPQLTVFHRHSASTGMNNLERQKVIWRSRALFGSIVYGRSYTILQFVRLLLMYWPRSLRRSKIKHFIRSQMPELNSTFSGLVKSFSPRPKVKF